MDIASDIINTKGLKGLSLAEIALAVGLNGSSVAYYFSRKNDLAAACFDRALDHFRVQIETAALFAGPEQRVAALIAGAVSVPDRPTARLSEMRAMEEPDRRRLVRRYYDQFRVVRGYFRETSSRNSRLAQIVHAQILLEAMHSLPYWLAFHALAEHGRIANRLSDLLNQGLKSGGTRQEVAFTCAVAPPGTALPDRFLDAATRLINGRGYRGASVDRIAAALKVTKGSFYHHVDAKNDLVLECFRRSVNTMLAAQDRAAELPGPHLNRLINAVDQLLARQLGSNTPLLRSTAVAGLPWALRQEADRLSEQAIRRFAGFVSDGIAEGSIRPVDPLIAGELLVAAVNVAVELRNVCRGVPIEIATRIYRDALLFGPHHLEITESMNDHPSASPINGATQ